MKTDDTRYTRVACLLHWLIAALILTQITLGLVMDHLTFDDMLAFSLFQTHRALGIVTLVLVLLRVIWRFGHNPPALPNALPPKVQKLAKSAHSLLYVGQLISPLSGWALASASSLALPLSLFGLFDWPLLPFPSDGSLEAPFRAVHHWQAGFWQPLLQAISGPPCGTAFLEKTGFSPRFCRISESEKAPDKKPIKTLF